MKVAVTGGSGFIGTAALIAGDKAGHEMWTFDRQDGHDILGDLSGLTGADAIIHLAGVLGTHELFDAAEAAVNINVVGSLRIMEWCIAHDAAYVGILMPDVFPSVYTATKVASKRLADALYHSKGLRVAHVRAFNAYGPGQKYGPGHPQKILPTFATYAWRQEPLPIWGSGNQTVDMIHAEDLGRMLVDALDYTDENVTFDGGTGIAMTVNQVAMLAVRTTGREWNSDCVQRLPMRRGENETHIVATGEGWDRLGWRPRYDTTLMQEAIQWYRP